VEHAGHDVASPEEAERIAREIVAMRGGSWTDREGRTRPLGERDFMVVAPYNAQVRRLPPRAGGGRAGRGPRGHRRQVPGPRGADRLLLDGDLQRRGRAAQLEFLFSRNRLNVAVSRAMGLACIVASPRLLESRARTIEQMRLVNALCDSWRWPRPTLASPLTAPAGRSSVNESAAMDNVSSSEHPKRSSRPPRCRARRRRRAPVRRRQPRRLPPAGHPLPALVGRRFDDFLAEPGLDLDAAWRTFLAGGEQTGELRIIRSDGEVRPVEYSATAGFVAGRHLAILRDITGRKRAEAERAELLRAEQRRPARDREALGGEPGAELHARSHRDAAPGVPRDRPGPRGRHGGAYLADGARTACIRSPAIACPAT